MPNGIYVADVSPPGAQPHQAQQQHRAGGSANLTLVLPSDPAHPILDPQMSPDGALSAPSRRASLLPPCPPCGSRAFQPPWASLCATLATFCPQVFLPMLLSPCRRLDDRFRPGGRPHGCPSGRLRAAAAPHEGRPRGRRGGSRSHPRPRSPPPGGLAAARSRSPLPLPPQASPTGSQSTSPRRRWSAARASGGPRTAA